MFYTFVNPMFDDSKYAYGESMEDCRIGKAKYCKGCGRPISMLEWLPPYEINISKKELGDFIWGGHVGFIISQNFKEKYETMGLDGLVDFQKVSLFYKGVDQSKRYYYPKIPLINAFVDLNNIHFEERDETCDVCQKGGNIISAISGVNFLEPNKIDKDIFFTTSLGQADIFISEKFKNFLYENNFSNAEIINSSNYVWDSLNPTM